MVIPGLFLPVFQTGYVTNDIDQAVGLFADTQGIGQWFRSPTGTLPSPDGGTMDVVIALAWIGHTMVEIIGCQGGNDQIYRRILPTDRFGVRLHHLGFRLNSEDEWAQMLDHGKRQGYKIALEVETRSTRALYFDTREALGHYLEYLYYFDEANSSLPHIPQNLAGTGN